MYPPKHNPTKLHCFLTQYASRPDASRANVSEGTPCAWPPWLARTTPGPPRESLVVDEPRISLPATPSLPRTTQGQLCVAPRSSRSRPASTEPGQEPRVSGGTASAVMQCPRPLRHPGGKYWHFLTKKTNVIQCLPVYRRNPCGASQLKLSQYTYTLSSVVYLLLFLIPHGKATHNLEKSNECDTLHIPQPSPADELRRRILPPIEMNGFPPQRIWWPQLVCMRL